MTTATADNIEQTVLDHVLSEIDCRVLGEEDGRVGCLTPLDYPNGDNVVVWVRARERDFEVTDYGEALADFTPNKGREGQSFEEFVLDVCRGQGVAYAQGRLSARCEFAALGEFVWRVATAAAQVAQAGNVFRARRPQRGESEFVKEVDRTLRRKELAIEREHQIEGQSGHRHRATFFVPRVDAVLEPVEGHWNQVTATYAKFGDLKNTNGFQLYSVLDDRQSAPDEEVAALLVQVSRVIEWSRREEWVGALL